MSKKEKLLAAGSAVLFVALVAMTYVEGLYPEGAQTLIQSLMG